MPTTLADTKRAGRLLAGSFLFVFFDESFENGVGVGSSARTRVLRKEQEVPSGHNPDDYETRRVYSSLRTDLHHSNVFEHRIDTLQLGIAPYEHDFDTLATWFVVQGRQYTGGIHEGTEWALLLRLFKRGAWIEAGVTDDGKLQAMAMVNF